MVKNLVLFCHLMAYYCYFGVIRMAMGEVSLSAVKAVKLLNIQLQIQKFVPSFAFSKDIR